jgi:restriction endonuclease S subunit
MTSLESVVKAIRNILRNESVEMTGERSLEHILGYLACRMLSREICQKTGQDKALPYCWETIVENIRLSDEDCVTYPEIKVVQEFRRSLHMVYKIFGISIDFKVTMFCTHREIVSLLDGIDPFEVEIKSGSDLLGVVYEDHIASGSSQNKRDRGQYFTPRELTRWIVQQVEPRLIDGVPESVFDPAMGTGGFLSSYIDHFGDAVEWSDEKNWSRVQGCDIVPLVAAMTRMNLFCRTKGGFLEDLTQQKRTSPVHHVIVNASKEGALRTRDTIREDIKHPEDPIALDRYDIILANPPFGIDISGEPCDSLQSMNLSNCKKSETLFLRVMMSRLAPGGRACIVIPEGVLTGRESADTRRHLVENFEVTKVVKCKDKLFKNTSLLVSLIFFKNSGKSTEKIPFFHLVKDDSDQLAEEAIGELPVEEMKRYAFALPRKGEEKSGIYRTMKLRDAVNYQNGKNIPERDRQKEGTYPYYASNGVKGYVEKFLFEGPAVLLADQGSSWFRAIHFVEEGKKFYAGNHTIVMKGKKVTEKFLYYLLLSTDLSKFGSSGTIIPEIVKEEFYDWQIQIPPLSVQERIVEALEATPLPTETLTEHGPNLFELLLRNPSGDLYRDAMLSIEVVSSLKKLAELQKGTINGVARMSQVRGRPKKLREILTNGAGGKTLVRDVKGGDIPFYSCSVVNPIGYHSTHDYDGESYLLFMKGGGNSKTRTGEGLGIGRFYLVEGKSAYTNHVSCFKIAIQVNHKYLKHVLDSKLFEIQDFAKYTTGLGHIPVTEMLDNVNVNIPPIEMQEKTLEEIQKIEDQIATLKQMIQEAEERSKMVMETYLNAPIEDFEDLIEEEEPEQETPLPSGLDMSKLQASTGRGGYTSDELKEFCKQHGLKTNGKKSDLVERLLSMNGGPLQEISVDITELEEQKLLSTEGRKGYKLSELKAFCEHFELKTAGLKTKEELRDLLLSSVTFE